MAAERDVDIEAAFELGTPIDEAMEQALLDAIEQHRRTGEPMVFWQDGRIVLIPADQVRIEDEPSTDGDQPESTGDDPDAPLSGHRD